MSSKLFRLAGGRFKKEVMLESQSHLLLIRDEGGEPEMQVSDVIDCACSYCLLMFSFCADDVSARNVVLYLRTSMYLYVQLFFLNSPYFLKTLLHVMFFCSFCSSHTGWMPSYLCSVWRMRTASKASTRSTQRCSISETWQKFP